MVVSCLTHSLTRAVPPGRALCALIVHPRVFGAQGVAAYHIKVRLDFRNLETGKFPEALTQSRYI